jgi:hypothetical protein
MSGEDTVLISNCPLCKGSHTYQLDVERTYYSAFTPSFSSRDSPKLARFTRFFICPSKNKKFQASFELPVRFGSMIKSVTVESVVEDKEE